ncbi:MAG: hypothetical protein QOE06_1419 [Thermoleophilaceae bacterium]|nr:hypothetical protein [Thermoleophilaceae bacterium]
MVGRLALRLGHDHEVTKAYDETVNIYHRMLIESKSALPDGGFVGCGARREAATRMEAVPDEFEAEFVAARRKFIAAAQRVVGADLGALA